MKWWRHFRYAREARRHNKRARELRLQKTTWRGFPLPTGKSGELRITGKMLIDTPQFVSIHQLSKQYEARADDLWVDMRTETDAITGDIVVTWKPARGRRPREHY